MISFMLTALCVFSGPDPDNEPNYSTIFDDAQPLCATYGGNLASQADLLEAFEQGWHSCSVGWLKEGVFG